MTKLTDVQLILLTYASQQVSGSLLPLPHGLADKRSRATAAINALLRRGLAYEKETIASACVYRTDRDLSFGIFITTAGLAAINIELHTSVAAGDPAMPQTSAHNSKRDTVLALLRRESGATLAELIQATSWLPHTTRAALTGLRKKGHCIERSKRGNVSCYHIAAAA